MQPKCCGELIPGKGYRAPRSYPVCAGWQPKGKPARNTKQQPCSGQ
jgi:hypothetical protein